MNPQSRSPRFRTFSGIVLALLASCDDGRVVSPDPEPPVVVDSVAMRIGETIRLPDPTGDSQDTYRLSFQVDSGKMYVAVVENGGRMGASVVHEGALSFYGAKSSRDSLRDSVFLPSVRSGTYVLNLVRDSSSHGATAILLEPRGLPDSLELPDAHGVPDSAIIPTDGTTWNLTRHGWAGMRLQRSDTITMICDTGFRYVIKDTASSGDVRLNGIFTPDGITTRGYETFSNRDGVTLVPERIGRFRMVFDGYSTTANYAVSVSKKEGLPAERIVDRYEPDNTMASASMIPPDSTWQWRTFHNNKAGSIDPDLVAFRADSGSTYRLWIEAGSMAGTAKDDVSLLATSAIIQAVALSSDSTRMVATESFGNGMRCLVIPANRTGTMVVRLASYNRGIDYRLALTTSRGLPATMSSTRGRIQMVDAPGLDSFSISMTNSGGDTDVVAVTVRKDRVYTFSHSIQMGLAHLKLALQGTSVVGKTRDALPMCYVSDRDGVLLLKIHQIGWYENPCSGLGCSTQPGVNIWYGIDSTMQYTLSVASAPMIRDTLEPDSTMKSAHSAVIGGAAIHRFLSTDDTDWFRFDVRSGWKTHIVVRSDSLIVSPPGYVDVVLLGSDSTVLGRDQLDCSTGDDSAVFDLDPWKSGAVHLKLAAYGENHAVPYYSVQATETEILSDSSGADGGIGNARHLTLTHTRTDNWGDGTRNVTYRSGVEHWTRIDGQAHGRYCAGEWDQLATIGFFDKDSTPLPALQTMRDEYGLDCVEARVDGPLFVRSIGIESSERSAYEANLSFQRIDDSGEVADSLAATPRLVIDSVYGQKIDAGRYTYHRVRLDSLSSCAISADGFHIGGLELLYRDLSTAELGTCDDTGCTIRVKPRKSGVYLVRVKGPELQHANYTITVARDPGAQ